MSSNLVILGGGIKGAATAAVASFYNDFKVTLIERDMIGSGTTSTNHGRLHLGTGAWKTESDDLIQRRRSASELIRALPDAIVSSKEGLYCFERVEDADQFQVVAKSNQIPCHIATDLDLASAWINLDDYNRVLSVPEVAFNPATLAGRFAQTCVNLGGRVLTKQGVLEVKSSSNNRLTLELENKASISADVIVNTMSRWCNSLQLPVEAPRPDIHWLRWRLLCLRASKIPKLPKLEQVIMIVDQKDEMPSVISHKQWITLDFKATHIEEVPSPESDDTENWRAYNSFDKNDDAIYNVVRKTFTTLEHLSEEDMKTNLFSLAGIHARRSNAPTGSQNYVETAEGFRGYFVAFGGQASTGLLDALDTVEKIRSEREMKLYPRNDLMKELINNLSTDPILDSVPMRWEQ